MAKVLEFQLQPDNCYLLKKTTAMLYLMEKLQKLPGRTAYRQWHWSALYFLKMGIDKEVTKLIRLLWL